MNLNVTTFVRAVAVILLASGCDGGGGSDAGTDAGPTLDCASYCSRIAGVCSGEAAQYPSGDACMAACAALPAGMLSDTGGNTLGCRVYHTTEVAELGAEHCDHAGPAGDEECGTNCEGFCTIALSLCADTYADLDACMTECEGFPEGVEYNAGVTSGDSFACRLAHLMLASGDDAECANITEASATCQ